MLSNLKVPLELNQMRTMKEPNLSAFRELIRSKSGGQVMNLIRDNQEALELEPGIFDLAFEGFWDLYTFKPQVEGITAKKLQTTWLPKIKLQVNESTGVPPAPKAAADGEEPPAEDGEANEGSEPYDPIAAVVRVRIAKKLPEPVEDEEGNMVEQEVNEKELEEVPIDDKCLQITTHNDGQNIFVIN